MGYAEVHPQSRIRPKSWLGGGGDDRTVDPGVPNHRQSRIKVKILIVGGEGDDRTVDPGVSKDVTCQPYSILFPSAMRME